MLCANAVEPVVTRLTVKSVCCNEYFHHAKNNTFRVHGNRKYSNVFVNTFTHTHTHRRLSMWNSRIDTYEAKLSYPFLKLTFVLVFLVFFTLLARQLLFLQQPFAIEQVSRKTDLSQAYIRPGLNVDNLPLVKIDYGKYKPNASTTPSDVDNGDNSGNDEKDTNLSLVARRQQCATRGLYLGPQNDQSVDCSDYCSMAPDEVEYAFFTDTDIKRILWGQTYMQPGAYCMPTRMTTCNRNTAIPVYSLAGWTCLPTTDAFAGDGGNRIIVCNGRLRDNATRTVYVDSIPPNLVFNDVYRDRLANGQYRFECMRTERDESGNLYIDSPFNRLHRMRNWCAQDVPFAVDIRVDWINGVCVCRGSQFMGIDPSTGRCTVCRTRFDNDTKQISIVQKPCFSFTDTVEQFENRLRDLRKQLNVADDDTSITMFPCGYSDHGSASEYTLPRCLDYNVAMYQPALPSHNTLNVIDSFS